MLRDALIGGAAGLATATALVTIMLFVKKSQLESRVARARVELMTTSAARSELATEAARMREEIGNFTRAETTRRANEIAERYIAEQFGLTRERIARMEALYRRYVA